MPKWKSVIKDFISSPLKSLLFIYSISLISFSNIFKNNFVLDDFSFVVNWPLIRNLKNIPQFFTGYVPPIGQEGLYTPLKALFHAFSYRVFGLNVVGHHIFSLLIHFTAIYLVYQIIKVLTKEDKIAFLTALFFALHPVHCESIDSIAFSIDTLGTVFMLCSFYFYVKRAQGAEAQGQKQFLLSLVFCLLAVYTQELTGILPLLIFWYEFCFHKHEISKKEMMIRVFPYVLIIFVYFLCKYFALGEIFKGKYIYDSFYLTMFVSIKALAKYVYLSLFPIVLTHNHVISKGIYSFDVLDFDKYYVVSQSIFDWQVILSLIGIGLLVYVMLQCLEKKPLISFAVGWFFLSLLPVMNILPSGVYFAERYLYIASVGFCLLMGLYFNRLYTAKGKVGKIEYSLLAVGLISVICLVYGWRIWLRTAEMKDEITVFQSAIKANPTSALMRNDLGIIYAQNNQQEKAIARFQEALSLRESPVTYFAMAEAYAGMGQNEKAESSLKMAIKLDPEFADAYYNLASLYAFWARMDKAKTYLDKAMFYYKKRGQGDKGKRYKEVFDNYFGAAKAKNKDK